MLRSLAPQANFEIDNGTLLTLQDKPFFLGWLKQRGRYDTPCQGLPPRCFPPLAPPRAMPRRLTSPWVTP